MKDNLGSTKYRIFTVLAVLAWLSSPFFSFFTVQAEGSPFLTQVCPSGKLSAKLTGWMLNGKLPVGFAEYVENSKQLKVSVTKVALADGMKLDVFIADEKIGQMESMKDGAAQVLISNPSVEIKRGSRVRVLNEERPIVSRNLACDNSAPSPTVSPSAVPTARTVPSPDVTPSVLPTANSTPSPTMTPSL